MTDKNTNIKERAQGRAIARNGYRYDTNSFINNMDNAIKEGEDMSKYNVGNIMREAWSIRRRAAAEMGCKVSEVFFVECLKMAWEQERNKAENVLAAWEEMSTEKQIDYLKACVKRAAKDEIAYSVEDKYNAYNENVAWFLNNHGLDEFVSEAWIKLAACLTPEYLERRNAKRAAAGRLNVSLSSLFYGAAVHAINKVWRDDVKHGRAQVKTITDKNGEQYSYIDTMATTRKDNTEAQALGSLAFAEFVNGRDEIDKLIIEGIRDGYKGKEIATMAGISAPAITKRLNKLREALRAAGMAPAWMAA